MNSKGTAISASATAESDPSVVDRVGRAVSFTRTQPSAPPDGCYRCRQEIYISFFFDGFGHSLKDGICLSNIGRLYHTHRKADASEGIYRLYYEGMGRPLSNETVGITGALVANTLSETIDAGKGALKDSVSDTSKKAAGDFAKTASHTGTKSGVKSAFIQTLERAGKEIERGTVLRKAAASLKSPTTFVPVLVEGTVESFPHLRDSEFWAASLGTGFNDRVEKARKDFTDIIREAQSDPRPIKFIRISMFGYDRGAVTARKFANELIEKICKKDGAKITYQGAEVLFDFMGLFDSVSSSYADTFFSTVGAQLLTAVATLATPEALGAGGAMTRVAIGVLGELIARARQTLGEFDTPGEFRKVVHHVAATELRFYKPVDSPRSSKTSGNLTEIVYPGSQSDVGGGFAEGDDGQSAELAKVSARNMLDQAWTYGVPVRRVEEIRAAGDPDTLQHFTFTKSFSVNGKTVTANDLFRAYTALLPTGKTTLEQQFLAHQKLFVSWARTLHDRAGTYSTGSHLFVNAVDAEVYNAIFPGTPTPADYGVRADYYDKAEKGTLRPDLQGSPHTVENIVDPTIRALASAWVKPVDLSPEVMAFFDHFVHNTITRWNNVSLGDGVFMQLRTIEEKRRKDQVTGKAGDAAKKVLPDAGQIRQEALKRRQDAYSWVQGSQRYPDPLELGSSIGGGSPLNIFSKE